MTQTDTPKNVRVFAVAATSAGIGTVGYRMGFVRARSKAEAIGEFLMSLQERFPRLSFSNADAMEIDEESMKDVGARFDGFTILEDQHPGEVSEIPAEIMSPDWSGGGKVHNWRTYISPEVRKIWDTFTPEQKKVLHQAAEDTAGKEDWA